MNRLLLVGAGPMAIEYARVLQAMDIPFEVVGRGRESTEKFYDLTGVVASPGGLARFVDGRRQLPEHAIVAVGEKWLGQVTLDLLKFGVHSLLVEKPGGLDIDEVRAVAALAESKKARVYVGYNRRFFASVIKAKEFIELDGGVTSFNFEFTEWSHIVSNLRKEDGVKENWLFHNSSHVMDLAFYLGGRPEVMTCFVNGSLQWHPAGSVFCGAGKSISGALFSYQANWEAPGRWALEILTRQRRLIFRPLEQLQVQNLGTVAIEPVSLDDELDRSYKPGIYGQVEAFLKGDTGGLCSIAEQKEAMNIYSRILNGADINNREGMQYV